MSINIGDKIPEFKLVNTNKETLADMDFLGKKTMFVFIPFPFSSVCDKEICELRDNQSSFHENETKTVLITVAGRPTNEAWANHYKKFIIKSKTNKIYFVNKKNNKKLFNLRKYVNDKLTKLNVIVDNINKDTFREKSKFFSYRRSQKLGQNDYGRCISVIAMTKFRQN